MGLQIRLATASDAPAIAEIHVRCWQFAYRGIVPDTVLDSLSMSAHEQLWRHTLELPSTASSLWVAEEGGRALGFCATGGSEDDDATPETGEVGAIYLRPDRIGAGVGQALFGQAVNDLRERGFRRATLWVFRDNERARRFYETAGWRPDGMETSKARGGADLLEMRYSCSLSDI